MGPVCAAAQEVQDQDQREPGSRPPRGTAWPPPGSLPALQGMQPSRGVPGQAGCSVGCGGCIRLGFTYHRPRERPRGPSPGDPGPGKSPAAAAKRLPGTGHRGSCNGAFTWGKKQLFGDPRPRQRLVTPPGRTGRPGCRARHGARWGPAALPLPAGAGHPAAGPGKISAVPGNLLTSEKKQVLEIKPHPRSRGERAGRRQGCAECGRRVGTGSSRAGAL